ncbi:MAG: beta-hydroxyacyl-ACP dehydratase [Pseudobacteriovorax sp.]|nr:beta-hydroxyacyl-ACP dehydratase [Pseudobacteriovorax sp.]
MDWNDISSISDKILGLLPQQDPFRFLDKIIEIDESHCVGQYTFKKDEYFYKGHFPGNPVTPGVILTETMAQVGVCSLSIYLLLKEGKLGTQNITTLFTEAQTEFIKPVLPGETVTIKAEKLFWRRNKLKCKTQLYLSNGDLAAEAELSGMGVIR